MNRKMRLLIADGHQFVADACRQMLEPEFEVTAVVADGRALVQAALQLKPDGAILEVTLPQRLKSCS
jgi:DNA-binding NarL/FixJ family response regulator